MDLAMEEKPAVIFAGSSSSLTTADDDISWDAWSPDLDCSNEYLNSLVFSSTNKSEHTPAAGTPFVQKCSFDSKTTPPAITAAGNKGERLLHLLMAAAEALSGDDQSTQDLARVILVRLNELLTGPSSGIERLAAHFTHGLHALVDHDTCPFSQSPAGEVLTACHMLHDMSPFASFGHLTANQAILEAFADERRVHVIDYDIAEGVQWASLIQAMASLRPPPHLKITALSNASYRSASMAQEAGRRLSAFAETVGQPFSFRMCRLDQRKKFQPAAVKIVRGEPVVVNCVLNGNGSASPSALSFLAGAAALGARLVTVVEHEGGINIIKERKGGNGKGNFFGRFMNELERYMAVWESLEAGFPKQGRVRRMVERVLLGPRIAEALQTAYGRSNGLEEASVEGCGQWMAAAGFEEVGLSFFNRSQARLLLGLFNDGYRVQEDASNKIALCWKSCQLLSASVWAIPPPPSPPPFGSIYL